MNSSLFPLSLTNLMSSTAIQQQKGNDLKSLLNSASVKDQISRALPTHLTPDRFVRVATTTLLRVPKLAECDQASFMKAMLDCSSLGLEPDGRRCHLIPFENRRAGTVECQLIIDYKGLIELAKRSGEVKTWKAHTVCQNDPLFEWENGEITHKIDWLADRGEVLAVYSHVTTKDGDSDYEVMTKAEVEAIRNRSRAGNSGPWQTDWSEMAKKTVLRRHSKRLTLSPEFHDAIERDADQIEERKVEVARPVMGREVPQEQPAPALFAPPQEEVAPAIEVEAESGQVANGAEWVKKALRKDGIKVGQFIALLERLALVPQGACEKFDDVPDKVLQTVAGDWETIITAVKGGAQ